MQTAKEEEWNFWRGSPELLAQVVRTAMRASGVAADREDACVIDVEVDGDHEIFSSPTDFTETVTREALRHFKRIDICTQGGALSAEIALVWIRPWWKPGMGTDATISLKVIGNGEKDVGAAFQTIRTSIQRGGTNVGESRQILMALFTSYALVTAVVAAMAGGLLLLDLSTTVVLWTTILLFSVGLVIASLWATWMYPTLEIAPHGQTNVARTVRFGGPLIVGFILTGVAKLIYG